MSLRRTLPTIATVSSILGIVYVLAAGLVPVYAIVGVASAMFGASLGAATMGLVAAGSR